MLGVQSIFRGASEPHWVDKSRTDIFATAVCSSETYAGVVVKGWRGSAGRQKRCERNGARHSLVFSLQEKYGEREGLSTEVFALGRVREPTFIFIHNSR